MFLAPKQSYHSFRLNSVGKTKHFALKIIEVMFPQMRLHFQIYATTEPVHYYR